MRRKTQTIEKSSQATISPLLTVADVAKILQLSKVKVYELIKKNGLPTVKISGARRIKPIELQARPQWVCWRKVRRHGKLTKVPYGATTGRKAESDNPETWASHAQPTGC